MTTATATVAPRAEIAAAPSASTATYPFPAQCEDALEAMNRVGLHTARETLAHLLKQATDGGLFKAGFYPLVFGRRSMGRLATALDRSQPRRTPEDIYLRGVEATADDKGTLAELLDGTDIALRGDEAELRTPVVKVVIDSGDITRQLTGDWYLPGSREADYADAFASVPVRYELVSFVNNEATYAAELDGPVRR